MKATMDKGISDLNSILPKVTGYDKELRLMQASVRQAHKDIKIQGDNLGEQIYNLTESTNGQAETNKTALALIKDHFTDLIAKKDIVLDQRFLDFSK